MLQTAAFRISELHRLAASSYHSADQIIAEYVITGCRLLDAESGAVYPPSSETPGLSGAIVVDGEVYGHLSFSKPTGPAFNKEDALLVDLLAAGIAGFLARERLRMERRCSAQLNQDRDRVLKMVAENRPLRETLNELAGLVERQCPGCHCAVLLDGETSAELAVAEYPIIAGTGVALGRLAISSQVALPDPAILAIAARIASIAIEQRQLTDRLVYQAQHDFLTGLPNRFRLMELLEQHLTQRSSPLAVLFIDLDRFKQINDSLGHSVGDRFLIEAAERLKGCLKSHRDVAARMGGDEFTAILFDAGDEDSALRLAREFLEAMRSPYLIDGRELVVTASIGLSLFPKHGQDASTLLRAADAAMYRAKRDGANGIECFVADTQPGAMERLDLENALRRALEKSEFELYYQPIVTLDGELTGLEVLLSWQHGKRGRIAPDQFIPMAEQTGLIVPIGSWVLRQACQQAATWLDTGLPFGRIAVNVSALQFARSNFVDTVAGALAASGLPARLLELELTESLVLSDIGESIHRMTQLRELGVAMAIDDFGTGYSSLNYLRRLPVNALKIDQSFLRDMGSGSGTMTVVETIVSLAHQMKLTVIAEGVETQQELELLRAAGCDRVQGHLFGQPMRAEAVAELLTKKESRCAG